MSAFSTMAEVTVRSVVALRSLGGWISISPAQTYVANSIPGLGACRSTYCPAERRERTTTAAPARRRLPSSTPLFVLTLAALLLAGRAAYGRLTSAPAPAAYACDFADCQNRPAPVSPDTAAKAPSTGLETAGRAGVHGGGQG